MARVPGALDLLTPDRAARIVAEAREALRRFGVAVHDAGALALFADHGARVDAGRAFLPGDLLDRALATAPPAVRLFDVHGRPTHDIGGDRQYFAPGSSATTILDLTTGETRPPDTDDYIRYVKVVSGLPHLAAQSTAFIPADVPAPIADSYRLYLSLRHGAKPVVTGTFSAAGFDAMRDLQLAVRGSPEALAAAPLTIFSCCPTSPLAWGADSIRTVMACAESGIPVEIVPMALAGFISPVSLAGTLVQHTAEALAGVAAGQLVRPGAPVLFGGASTIFDVRYETTPMGAVESMLLACGAAQIGRHLGLPTQVYIALSDAKALDAQAGLETGLGAALAAAAGINEVSGPGLLDFGTCFSLEKLVADHEACAIAARLRAGIQEPATPPLDVIEELLRERHLLIADDTRTHLREVSWPGAAIDRSSRQRWIEDGKATLEARLTADVARRLRKYEPPGLSADVTRALEDRMRAEARRCQLDALPVAACGR